MDSNTNKRLNKYEEAQNKHDEEYSKFLKNITVIATGLLGLLIGLKPEKIHNIEAKDFFLLSIALIGLCILFSLITQFSLVNVYKKLADIRWKQLLEYIKNQDGNTFQFESVNKPLIYKISERMTFACLILSILSLILYVYFLEYY